MSEQCECMYSKERRDIHFRFNVLVANRTYIILITCVFALTCSVVNKSFTLAVISVSSCMVIEIGSSTMNRLQLEMK